MAELKIAPSILSADFTSLGGQIRELENEKADMLHFDVMDGKFVQEISYGEPVLRSLKKITGLFMDVHLMIEDPLQNIDSFVASGADSLTFHLEAAKDPKRVIDRIHAGGIKAALAIRPDTPVESLYPYLDDLDMVLIMTVYPGFGGQKFIPSSLERLKQLRSEFKKRGLDTDIQVDGGINADTISEAAFAGANIFVAGSAVFKGNIRENIKTLRSKYPSL